MSLIKLCIFLLQFTVSFSVFGESFTSTVISSSEWDVANNPKLFFKNIDYTFRETSRESRLSTEKKLWSDDYWARYRGSIAYRWQDGQRPERNDLYQKSQIQRLKKSDIARLSPAEKMDLLEGDYDFRFTKRVLGRNPKSSPSWQGICHGWAEASINHPQAKAKTLENPYGLEIPFGVSDIHALLGYYYGKQRLWGKVKFLGRRCYHKNDEFYNCDGMNPGAFHVVLVESLKRNRSFVVDIDPGPQVWNHPVVGYKYKKVAERVASEKSDKSTVREVKIELELHYLMELEPSWNQKKPYVSTRKYYYWLELNEKSEILGGTWDQSHKIDFAWYRNKGTLPKRLKQLLN